ncbi:MbcA/ParS/Xre antitoxin family protein [Luteibacter aegosomaticola]|uniref:MbcA/ParS/Xre antitoxin family protein n=1 Tax=Luteibacter aegosomaticola TaxID=2911538 RepID=UPI001FFB37E9|nr:MbcA/ParS/Xre antitoxin family protein [Luteibacter aegosomaticola]UPG89457.1 MbcA/ParS/Xre antitoxin family protein [Luteibacter aegosomaticola]
MPAKMLTRDIERVMLAAKMVSGDPAKADEWLNQPLASLDGKTPLQLIAEGRTDAVIGYLHSIASGFVG